MRKEITMTRWTALGAVLVCLGGGACRRAGGAATPDNTIKASCSTLKTLSVCNEYTSEAFALGENLVKGSCESTRGVWSQSPCPTEKRVGSCTISGGQTRRYYAEGAMAYHANGARKDCVDLYSGTFQGQ
jgi:hypothetical protein